MDYVSVSEAKSMPGLRLACVKGIPSPWSLAARAVLELRGVDFVPFAQEGNAPNTELVEWTGHRNAPVAVYDDEAPRVRWLEIVHLAERLGSGPSLIPTDLSDRMTMVGLTSEMSEPYGFAWNGRLLLMSTIHDAMGDAALDLPIFKEYGWSQEAADASAGRAREFITMLADRLKAQRSAGSDYLVTDSLTAADIYWAYFSVFVDTMTPEQNPMEDQLRAMWDASGAKLGVVDPIVIEHRDRIFEKHLKLPLEY